jgi:hypothetical protein
MYYGMMILSHITCVISTIKWHIKCDLHHRFTYQRVWSPQSIPHITMCDLHHRFTYEVCILHHRFHISSVISTIDFTYQVCILHHWFHTSSVISTIDSHIECDLHHCYKTLSILLYYCSVLGRMREYWRALQILHHKGTTSSQMGGLRITGICWYLLLSTFLAFCDDPIETYIIVSWMDGWMYVHVHVWMNFVVKLTFQHTIVFASCR